MPIRPVFTLALLAGVGAGCAGPSVRACCTYTEVWGPGGPSRGAHHRCVRLDTAAESFIVHDDAGCACSKACPCWNAHSVVKLEATGGPTER